MKRSQTIRARLGALGAGLALLSCATVANAHPYAANLSVTNGVLVFFMSESGATVNVVWEDGTTNAVGTNVPKGVQTVPMGSHTSYQIIATKQGSGAPNQYTTDSNFWNAWSSPRGVAVNQNPKNGAAFGRVYVANTINTAVRQWGIYALTADMSTNAFPAMNTNAWAAGLFQTSSSYSPYHIAFGQDGNLYAADYSTAGATVWQFGPSFEFTNMVLAPLGENQGIAAGTHGDPIGVAAEGSLANGNLKIYTSDPGLAAPASASGNFVAGGWNNVFRYDINGSSLPYSNAPNWAVNVGLAGFWDSQLLDVCLNQADSSKVYACFYRANASDGCIQVFDKVTGARLYTSLHSDGTDPVFGSSYAMVAISPDGKYLITSTAANVVRLVNLINGIPDESSIVTIAESPTTGNQRHLCWDAADNFYTVSSGQAMLKAYSLGITSTCITSNDVTCANGSFQLVMPDVIASISTVTSLASQNYTNNAVNPGAPIPGVIRISLNKYSLVQPVTVNFGLSGSAALNNQYVLNQGTDANGVIITANSVTFPAYPASAPGSTWTADIKVIPTAAPVTGPTTTATVTMKGGTSYVVQPPLVATVAIANTGPQLLTLSAAGSGTSMNRSIAGDYAQFVITRTGDTNGPSNSAGNVTPMTYTVTNINYYGTATNQVDYLAAAQRQSSSPDNSKNTISIRPGDVAVTCMIGNPVPHGDIFAKPVTATATLNITNQTAVLNGTNLVYTNCFSSEGLPYNVATAAVSMNELDNRVGVENQANTLYINPLTSVGDSRNWTVTYSDAARGNNALLPAVIPNYVNGVSETMNGGTNDFDVQFGYPIANDGIPQSPIMVASNWTSALRMTVNKAGAFAPAGVNALATGKQFSGNYAFRFDMYLSIYSGALNNPYNGTIAKEFASWGIGHYGTNCNWRPASIITAGNGCAPTNSDGCWFAIDADAPNNTPADFDGLAAPALPHGDAVDTMSNPSSFLGGVFKHPPFPFTRTINGGVGAPINKWVSVSVEVTANTNVSCYIDGNKIVTSFANTNGGFCTNGTIMLGYMDPYNDLGDYNSQCVYYSNVRVVELQPSITLAPQPQTTILTKGSTLVLSNKVAFGTAPVTNLWYANNTSGSPVGGDTNNSSGSINSTLTFPNIQTGYNYYAVASDSAGSMTSQPALVEVVNPIADKSMNLNSTNTIAVTVSGPAAPTSYQWKFNGNNLTASSHYLNVTTATLTINKVQATDAGTYSVACANAGGTVTQSMVLSVVAPPSGIIVTPPSLSTNWGTSASFTVSANGTAPFTYTWKKNGVKLTDTNEVSGSATSTLVLSPLTNLNATTYTVGVTNAAGGGIGTAVLTLTAPQPVFSGMSIVGGNAVLTFTSSSSYDTTGAFLLQCSPNVQGPYTNTPGTVTTSGNGIFQVTLPTTSDPTIFYRLQHAN